jgi:quercetin dioxygenase-like cupin family protein
MTANSCLGRAGVGWCKIAALLVAGVAAFAGGRLAGAREAVVPVVPLIGSGETVVGETIAYPQGAPAKVTAAIVGLGPGEETGWHTHGIPTFALILDGELSVDYGDKGTRVYRAGEAFLEAIDVPHNGRNTGSGPMRILAVFMGADGLPTTVPVAGPK